MRAAPSRDFDVIVAGGGVTATVMAALLVALKLCAPGRVAVVANPPPASLAPSADWDLRVFALSRASQRILTLCGAWQRLAPDRIFAYERMCVWDSRGEPAGPGSLTFDCAELGEANLGFIVEGRALQLQCRAAAIAAGAVFIDSEIAGIEEKDGAVRLALGDGREIEGTLLIGADAAASPTRRLLGIETAGHAYHQDALVAHVSSARPHAGTARQRFLPGGPLAFLPLPDGRCSIVWSVARAEAARLLQLDAASFGHELTTASGHCLGDCVLTTPIAAFPLQLQYATDYVRGRGVLVGDAAHAVHPLAGQGLNLGLMDCAALAQVLAEAAECGAGRSDRRVLRRYERWRRAENLMAVAALDGLERLFSSDQPAVIQLRMAGLGAVARLPFVKRDFAARALGLRGDVPRFLTVEA